MERLALYPYKINASPYAKRFLRHFIFLVLIFVETNINNF
jgi:hypothetical protein